MTAGISRETWDRTVERYMLAPYCEHSKSRGDEVLFLSNYISAVRLSDESTYLVHPLFAMPFDTKKIVIELTENAVKDYDDSVLFKDSNTLGLINNALLHLFEDQRYYVTDSEKMQRIESLISVAKEKFYEKLRMSYQTQASPLPKPHPPAEKFKQYLTKPTF
ncbi:TPA: hypothetical protein H1016_03660 [archaeon]|uniref:Uncharacterized protein n=1 Tax=Candidatus Naiadarchaeum limnaeum TaxID=2756139 RepID=A0A832V206_9ARCH|nr:hypothetical protein [Candidatus Naiadarchaeum limnaeum]